MKQRTTYLLRAGSSVDVKDIEVSTDSLDFQTVGEADEEWKLTLGLDELPDEIQALLQDSHELHIRWTTARDYESIPPLIARTSPGLHVFFTPREGLTDPPICGHIRKVTGSDSTKCESVSESFIRPPILSERFASSSTYQYYQPGGNSELLADSFLNKLCSRASSSQSAREECNAKIHEARLANYIDVDFDAISHAVILTVQWSAFHASSHKQRLTKRLDQGDHIEVGILQIEKPMEPEELSLGGFLTVLGEDERPATTLFSFPSRHHPLPLTSFTSFHVAPQQPTGLHPKLDIIFSQPQHLLSPPKPSCALHAYWTLPSTVFLDPYQLADRLLLQSNNLAALHSLAGASDLELPDWAIKQWGSSALVQLRDPRAEYAESSDRLTQTTWTATIPTHLRYVRAANSSDHTTVQIPWPAVFWACEAEEGLKMSTNPFDRVNLGYDGLFGPKTMFYHVPPAVAMGEEAVLELQVPTLDANATGWVTSGTFVAVLGGFLWILWQLLRTTGLRRIVNVKVE